MEKTQMLGRTEGRRRSDHQRVRWLDGITDSMVRNREAWRAAVYGVARNRPWLSE